MTEKVFKTREELVSYVTAVRKPLYMVDQEVFEKFLDVFDAEYAKTQRAYFNYYAGATNRNHGYTLFKGEAEEYRLEEL